MAGVAYQTFTGLEFLVTDDGSTDDSRSIIEEAARFLSVFCLHSAM